MKISYRKIFELKNALQRLGNDQVERRVDQGIIREYYKLGATRIAIATNLNMLDKPVRDIEAQRREIHGKHGNPAEDVKDDKWIAFAAEVEALADTEIDLDLIEISDKALNLEQNELPMSILVPLSVLRDLPAPSKKKR